MTNQQTEFMALYEPLHQRLSNYCRSMARNRSDAGDLLNDTILSAYEQFGQLEHPDRFAGYLFTIASNLFKKQLRRKKFRGKYDEKEALMLEDLVADTETRAELSIVLQKMELLPNLQREALILFHISDLPVGRDTKHPGRKPVGGETAHQTRSRTPDATLHRTTAAINHFILLTHETRKQHRQLFRQG